jgi:hypothetical protein
VLALLLPAAFLLSGPWRAELIACLLKWRERVAQRRRSRNFVGLAWPERLPSVKLNTTASRSRKRTEAAKVGKGVRRVEFLGLAAFHASFRLMHVAKHLSRAGHICQTHGKDVYLLDI